MHKANLHCFFFFKKFRTFCVSALKGSVYFLCSVVHVRGHEKWRRENSVQAERARTVSRTKRALKISICSSARSLRGVSAAPPVQIWPWLTGAEAIPQRDAGPVANATWSGACVQPQNLPGWCQRQCDKDFQPLSAVKTDPEQKIPTLQSDSRESPEHQQCCPMPGHTAPGWGQCPGWSQGGRDVSSSNFPNFQGAPISFLGGCIK